MEKSESIKELASALSKAQAEFAGAAKDSLNPHFKSKYADLESIVCAIKQGLASNGLSFVQVSHNEASSASIETIIMHSSGEWLSAGIVSVPVSKNDAQGYGSAMTYARRYSLSSAFGIAPEDDDGNAASKAQPSNELPIGSKAARDFRREEETLKACGSIQALSIAWSKMDKPTQHVLSPLKDECKNKILAIEAEAKRQEGEA